MLTEPALTTSWQEQHKHSFLIHSHFKPLWYQHSILTQQCLHCSGLMGKKVVASPTNAHFRWLCNVNRFYLLLPCTCQVHVQNYFRHDHYSELWNAVQCFIVPNYPPSTYKNQVHVLDWCVYWSRELVCFSTGFKATVESLSLCDWIRLTYADFSDFFYKRCSWFCMHTLASKHNWSNAFVILLNAECKMPF